MNPLLLHLLAQLPAPAALLGLQLSAGLAALAAHLPHLTAGLGLLIPPPPGPPPPGGGGDPTSILSSVVCPFKTGVIVIGALMGSLSLVGACATATMSFWSPNLWNQKKAQIPIVIGGLVGLACIGVIMSLVAAASQLAGGSSLLSCT